MNVVQTTFAAFHHFDLARQLHGRGMLQHIYSTWPWARLQREGLPRGKVTTFPWLSTPEYLLRRAGMLPRFIEDEMGYANALLFDEFTLRNLPHNADALIALSGSSLKTGQELKRRGGVFFCDRGSSHQRAQSETVTAEYRRWGVDAPVSDERDTVREEKIYDACDGIVVPAHFAAQTFIDRGVPRDKLHVIPYGVDISRFQPTAEPSPASFEVLFAGSVSLRKGVPYLLHAFAALQHPHKRLRVVGGISPEIKPVLAQLPQHNVEWLGALPQTELAAIMSTSHVMVLPSVEEGLALVQGQALACGCPVIATPNTGAEDLFTDNVEGFIVAARDVTALTQRMQQLADDATLQKTMRAAALARVQNIGGWQQYGDKWEHLLRTATHASQ